jgi:hypothetical protein
MQRSGFGQSDIIIKIEDYEILYSKYFIFNTIARCVTSFKNLTEIIFLKI